MRPTLQDVIERAWNETANLPDGEKPKIHDNQLALELARYYEQDGHTAQQREDALKADTWTLLCAYSFALRGIPRYWKPEPIRTKKAYHYMALSMRSILRDLIILAFDMGLRLPQDTLKEYERHELWVQDFKPDVAQLYGEISGDEASTPTTPQPIPKDEAEGQQPAANEDEASIPTIHPINNDLGELENRIYRRALKKGYIRLDGQDHYTKGSATWALIAYMCGRIYCKDRVKGDYTLFKGRNFPAKQVKELFNSVDIANHRDQLKDKPPRNYSKIDELFENPEASH